MLADENSPCYFEPEAAKAKCGCRQRVLTARVLPGGSVEGKVLRSMRSASAVEAQPGAVSAQLSAARVMAVTGEVKVVRSDRSLLVDCRGVLSVLIAAETAKSRN